MRFFGLVVYRKGKMIMVGMLPGLYYTLYVTLMKFARFFSYISLGERIVSSV